LTEIVQYFEPASFTGAGHHTTGRRGLLPRRLDVSWLATQADRILILVVPKFVLHSVIGTLVHGHDARLQRLALKILGGKVWRRARHRPSMIASRSAFLVTLPDCQGRHAIVDTV
jgi:hypothetical protein